MDRPMDVDEIDFNVQDFFLGQVFNSAADVKHAVKAYNRRNSTDFVVTTNNAKSLLVKCCHGYRRKSQSSGKRPRQFYNFIGCQASLNMYKRKIGDIKVTKVILEHNHPLNLLDKANVGPDEKKLISTLVSTNAQTSQTKRVLSKKVQKTFSTQKLKNMMNKLLPSTLEQNTSLGSFFKKIEDDGGKVDYIYDDKEDLKTLFVATRIMIDAFSSSDPLVVQVDLSFDIDSPWYKIAALCYLNPTTNKTEVTALAYIADETAESFDFMFKCFYDLCPNKEKIFIVDKDFTQLDSIIRNFSQSTVLLCQFRTLDFIRTLLATALVRKEEKDELYTTFKQVVYANTEEIYDDRNKRFLELCGDTKVRIGQDYRPLRAYYVKNWVECKSMWVNYYRKTLPTMGDNTTNQIDRTFWGFKQSIRDSIRQFPDTSQSIIHAVNLTDSRIMNCCSYSAVKSLKIFDNDAKRKSLNDAASIFLNDRGRSIFNTAQDILEKDRSMMSISPGGGVQLVSEENIVKMYDTSLVACSCSFYKTHQAPCAHILFLKETKDRSFTTDGFHNRYLNSIDQSNDSTCSPSNPSDVEAKGESIDPRLDEAATDNEVLSIGGEDKYKMIIPVLLRIGNVISAHSSTKFLQYIDELEKVESRVCRGLSILTNDSAQCDVHVCEQDNPQRCANSGI